MFKFNIRWSKLADNVTLRHMCKSVIGQQSKDAAERLGVHHRFIFQNHAFEEDNVFARYGRENLRRLHSIRQRVGPKDVFQGLQPGYFKLGSGHDIIAMPSIALDTEEPRAKGEL